MVIIINGAPRNIPVRPGAPLGKLSLEIRLLADVRLNQLETIVRKSLSTFRLAAYALCMLSLFGLRAYGQEKDHTYGHPNGSVHDWSRRHVVYPRVGPIHSLIAVQHDRRAISSWQAAAREDWHRVNDPRHFRSAQSGFHRDWSILLTNCTPSASCEGTAPDMYPAKYSFDTSAPVTSANCLSDFIVYPVNSIGASNQPNIVAFNNLYSGSPTGFCDREPTPPLGDGGVTATVMWSYDVTAAGGAVPTSPTLSLDGTKVAFVESSSSTTAHFHVLAWKSGDGVDTTTPDAQNVLKPKTITSGFATVAPNAGSGTVTDLALGSTSDTLSSPFIDYDNDSAYVGNDSGVLFRITNVFCTTGACTVGTSPAPVLDSTWGTGGALTTGCTGKLTGPVLDGAGDVFVGCSDGKLYAFNTTTGAQLTGSPLSVGDGTTYGGIVDPPMVDAVNGFVYVVSVNTGIPVVVQVPVTAGTALNTPSTATLAAEGSFNLHNPDFNNAYYTGTGTPLLYELAANSSAGVNLYGIGFTGTPPVMNAGTPGNVDTFGIGSYEISPLTEFYDGNEDRFFDSVLGLGSLASWNITTTFPSGFETSISSYSSSGIVVDNDATGVNQADSLYFSNLINNSAVKLTQSGLH